MQINFILLNIYYDCLHMILHPLLSQPVHCLSAGIRSLSTHPILSLHRNHTFTIKYLLRPFTHDSPPTLTPSLSIVWAPKFGHCQPNTVLFLPRNHAFTIKTFASYLVKSLSTSKLLISALEIHWHFIAFSCSPFCLIFSKPTLTVSFGKYRLSIVFSLITS